MALSLMAHNRMESAASTTASELIAKVSSYELRRLELRSRRRVDSDLLGAYQSVFRGTGLVFSDLREYQPGDDVKHIHWKATARSGRVFVKSYVDDRSLSLVLMTDVSASLQSPSDGGSAITQALEFATLVALLGFRAQDALGLATFDVKLTQFLQPARSRSQFHRVVRTMCEPQRSAPEISGRSVNTDLGIAIDELAPLLRRRSVVFIVSDFFTPPFADALRRLRQRHEVVLCQCHAGPTLGLPSIGMARFRDPESGAFVTIDTSNRRVRVALREAQARRSAALTQIAHSCGAELITLGESPVLALQRLFSRRQASRQTGQLRAA